VIQDGAGIAADLNRRAVTNPSRHLQCSTHERRNSGLRWCIGTGITAGRGRENIASGRWWTLTCETLSEAWTVAGRHPDANLNDGGHPPTYTAARPPMS